MGVNLALTYAAKWPEEVRAIVGLGFPCFPNEQAAIEALRVSYWMRYCLERPRLAPVVIPITWWLGRHGLARIARYRGFYDLPTAVDALLVDFHAFRSTLIHCMVQLQINELLRGIGEKPCLFVHGSADRWVEISVVRTMLALIQRQQLIEIPNTPHNVAFLAPETVASIIINYLNSEGISLCVSRSPPSGNTYD